MTGGPGWRLSLAAREPDQAGRLRRFRDAHPAVDITPGDFHTIHAWIPAGGDRAAGREIVCHSLRELLDRLERVFRGPRTPPDAGLLPPEAGSGDAGERPG